MAVAAVARRLDVAALGIDVEPATALPSEMLALVVTPRERRTVGDDPLQAQLLFAIKEAVYKAAYPLDGTFLEFGDIEVDLDGSMAVTRGGRVFALRYLMATHIVTLALA